MKYAVTVDNQTFMMQVSRDNQVTVDGQVISVDFFPIDQAAAYSLLLDRYSYEVLVNESNGEYQVLLLGHQINVRVQSERAQRSARAGRETALAGAEVYVKAPMPGLVVAVPATEGQSVKKGDVLVVLESMKMQNELKAPRDGVVSAVRVTSGQNVEQNQTLVTIT